MIQARTERTIRNKALGLGLLLAALLAAIVLAAKPVHADTTFTVNSTVDSPDASTADNKCDVDLTAAEEQCTFRAALQQANATTGADTIDFNIPGSGPHTISPTSFLPNITEAVTIDGYSQGSATADTSDDAKPNTLAQGTNAVLKIELDGTNAGRFTNGLTVFNVPAVSNVVVRGLAINRFGRDGIVLAANSSAEGSHKVEGNFIGTDPSGTEDLGNRSGVRLDVGSNSTIGGTTPEARNLISGNGTGIDFPSSDTTGNKVEGNLIGTQKDGTSALGNTGSGVFIRDADDNVVGGTSAGAANTIAFNGEDGVTIKSPSSFEPPIGNHILGNSIFSNGEEGIDLDQDGVTANDSGDADNGPNNLQNFPNLTFATASSTSTAVLGTLNSTPSSTFTLQFFANPEKDPSGFGEGQKFLGEKAVTTDSNGNATFLFSAPVGTTIGQFVTATATSASGDTSEFSEAKQVQPPPKRKKRR